MALLRRGIVHVSLFPVGSVYKIRFPMPNSGDCWFTADESQDISSFLEEIKREDKTIMQVHTDHPSKRFKEAANDGFNITINNTVYSLRKNAMAEVAKSKTTIELFMENLENTQVNNKKDLDRVVTETLSELGEQFGTYLSILKNSVNEIDLQIQAINQKEEEIKKKINFHSNLFCTAGLSFLVTQWGFFYYTIYEVDWLGWDLMEPITFSVGQFGFVLSLYYYLQTKNTHSYETMLARFESKKKQMLLRKHHVDIGRIKFLQEEKNRILSLIDVIEQRLV